MVMTENDSSRTITAVERSIGIINALKREGSMGVSELSRELGLSKGTVHTHLTTLAQEHLVDSTDGKYRLSLRFLSLSEQVKDRIEIYGLASTEIDSLAQETGERTQFAMLEADSAVVVYRAMGEDAIRASTEIGEHGYLHCNAFGKAMLAYLPDHRVEAIIDEHGLPKHTENTITDGDTLKEHLDSVREAGYATDDEELLRGIRCIGTPIRDEKGRLLGAISISGPARRMTDEYITDNLLDHLLRTANIIEVNAELS